ncbi:arylamine N-acetyltransferase [Acinetobacter guillouiae]|uniref:arylamine N-acetyltransferase family protein n=1 Tax=Acinetobacter guillouiae TaxID=106649 RepID=UPI0028D6C5E9|nr:arylamine N-acetyltransferase [Acinetobacter guillouiae]
MSLELSVSQKYLTKLGVEDKYLATLENLKKLLFLHVTSIPFGNISSFLGDNVSMELSQIADKLLDQGREGYCLEQSTLTRTVLNELGYEAFNLLGRVYYQSQPIEAPIRTHLVTVVKLVDKLYLFDPSFGGTTPTAVLSLDKLGEIQNTPHEAFRFIDVKDSGVAESALTGVKIMLQAYIRDEWVNIYALDPEQKVSESDAVIANWYIATSPDSIFTQHLMLAAVTRDERINLSGTTVKIHGKNHSIKKELTSEDEFREYLEKYFKINTQQPNVAFIFKKIINPAE